MPAPLKGERWGILGGSFDPVHAGHINLAEDIKDKKKLNGIILVPSFNHPFKKNQSVASYEDRLEMLKTVSSKRESFLVSCIERDENLSGYTLDTIRALKNNYPDVELYFIIGSDNLSQLSAWYKPEEIIKEVKLLSGTRPKFDNEMNGDILSEKIEFVSTSEIDISSSDIRGLFKENRGFEQLSSYLDEDVYNYIIENKLYR